MKDVLILGRGNYCKCILNNYQNKANFFTIDNLQPKRKYDLVVVTYPINILPEKLKIIDTFNWDSLIHLNTNGRALEFYIPYIKKYPDKNFVFNLFGLWHTRKGIIERKYFRIPALLIGNCSAAQLINDLFNVYLIITDNIHLFIINYHNTLLHSVLISYHTNRKYFYNYDIKQNIYFSKKLKQATREMNLIYSEYTKKKIDFDESLFYFTFMYYLSITIPFFMMSTSIFPKNQNRYFYEDLQSLHYIYQNRKSAQTPIIKEILDIHKYNNLSSSDYKSIDDVYDFYKYKMSKCVLKNKVYNIELIIIICVIILILIMIIIKFLSINFL